MKVAKGYKQTEVGIIPNDWELKKLGEVVVKFINGGTPSTVMENYWKGNIPWVTGADIVNQKISEIRRKINQNAVNNSATNIIGKGNLLLVTRTGVGKMTIAPYDVAISQDITGIYVGGDISPEYLFRFLDFNSSKLKSLNQGTSINGITRETLTSTFVCFPPTLKEQDAIATAISEIDSLISSLEKLIAKKRNIKKGAMQKLLTLKEGWSIKKLGEVLKVKHGKSQKEIIIEGGIFPILATGGIVGRTNSFIYDKPSVLIGRKGTIDTPQYQPTPFWAIDTIFYTEVFDNYFPKFIFYHFCLIDWYAYNEASGVPSLNAKTIENIELAFPKEKAEQERIANILSEMDSDIINLEKKVSKYKMLKQGMMQNLLTGKIRLINQPN